jgi:Ca2+-transporting ATPase
MLNALNAISENGSLLQLPPWANPWLLLAVSLSIAQHLAILYVPSLAAIFGVAPLSSEEWLAVLACSVPVVLLDEVLKLGTRLGLSARESGRAGPSLPTTALRIVRGANAVPRGYAYMPVGKSGDSEMDDKSH